MQCSSVVLSFVSYLLVIYFHQMMVVGSGLVVPSGSPRTGGTNTWGRDYLIWPAAAFEGVA